MPKITVQEKVTREIDLTFEQLVAIVKSLPPEDVVKLKSVLSQAESEKNWLLQFAGAWQLDDHEYEQFQRDLQAQRHVNAHSPAVSVDEE